MIRAKCHLAAIQAARAAASRRRENTRHLENMALRAAFYRTPAPRNTDLLWKAWVDAIVRRVSEH